MQNRKHISGISFVTQGSLYVIFNYCTDVGFDTLGAVEDVTIGGTAPTSVTYSSAKVTIVYQNYTEPLGGSKTYNVTFASGYNTNINVDVLGAPRAIAADLSTHIGLAKDCAAAIDYTQSLGSSSSSEITSSYGAVAESDPASVFSNTHLWEIASFNEAVFNGNQITSIWTNSGIPGGKANSLTSNLQHVRYVAAVGITIAQLNALGINLTLGSVDLLADALYGAPRYKAITAFDWSLDLTSCKAGAINTYSVCKDSASPNYFATTETDCNGVEIPNGFLNGAIPAIFIDGCACATDCSEVNADLSITNAINLPGNVSNGSFTLTVTGGAANYTYSLIVPSGVTYLEDATPPATSSNTYTFENVPGTSPNSSGIYIISVTDSTGIAGGCTRSYSFHMPITGDGNNNVIEGCTDPLAINYNPNVTVDNGSCVSCKKGNVQINGLAVGSFVDSSASLADSASSSITSDGSLQYNGVQNPATINFLPQGNLWNLELYSVSAYGETIPPTSTPIIGVNGLANPVHIFETLGTGWYAVIARHSGAGVCQTTSWHFIGENVAEEPCDVFANVTVLDPCTGALGITYSTPGHEVIIEGSSYLIDGEFHYLGDSSTVFAGQTVTLNLVLDGTCSTYTEDFVLGEALFDCTPDPEPEILGCTDSTALNYNPNATVNDGSCQYPTLGCTDPEASNFNSLATIDDGSCVYGISGCMDPEATNYDPNAIIDDGSCYDACSEQIISTITVQGTGTIVITFVNITTSYSVTWLNNETGESITTEDTAIGPNLIDGSYTVTVVDGNGCTDTYAFGVNTDLVYGCMDPYADNFSPAANVPYSTPGEPGSIGSRGCTYSFELSPCTPNEIEVTKKELDTCLSSKLGMLFNMLKAGRITPCKEKTTKVLVLLKYLLSRRGLECVYNCADSLSPTYSETTQGESCSTKWSEGGPTGESLVWDINTTYSWGDVVQHPTSLDIYTMTYTQGSYIPSDPETTTGQTYWSYCREPFSFADTTNRLDSYLAFIRNECKDCGIAGFTPIPQDVETNPNTPSPTTEEGQRLTIEGDTLEMRKKL